MASHGSANATAPAKKAIAVTPHDTNLLTNGLCRALYIGGTGALVVRMADGGDATFAAVPVGVLSIQVDRVYATGTGATNIVALY